MTHVAITGASSGIGAALVREFVQAGARVTMVSRRRAEMAALAESLGPRARIQIFVADLADVERATEWLAPAEAGFGPIDVLINNAGQQIVGPSAEVDFADIETMLALNLRSPMKLTRAVLPAMLARRDGTIVDVTSSAALAPVPGMWGYNASKGGLGAAAESLRGELRNTGVHIVAVYPGPVDTPMARAGYAAYPQTLATRILPEGKPDELARLVRSAVELKRPHVIYPSGYWLTRYFPGITRWFLDRVTPQVHSRAHQRALAAQAANLAPGLPERGTK